MLGFLWVRLLSDFLNPLPFTKKSFSSQLNEDEGIRTMREALKRGINYIDTAPYYGQGESESVIGRALQGIPRKAYYIATKTCR